MRDDFLPPIKDSLAKRVGCLCSNPNCRQPTSGPQNDPNKTVNVGVAAHITAASPDGPRYDPSLTAAQRKSLSNAIWLCQNCAKLIDNDPIRYNVSKLFDWKNVSEDRAISEIERRATQQHSDSYKAMQTKWILVLSATVDEVNREKAEAIVEHLRKLSGDTSMTLVKIKEGSVLLTIESSLEGYEKIEALIRSGNLNQINGITIKSVRLEDATLEQDVGINSIIPHFDKTPALDSTEFLTFEQRLPLILLIDVSGSMQGVPIHTLNEGLRILKEELMIDEIARRQIEVALITFGTDVAIKQDFTTIDSFYPPTLSAEGATATGAAINRALDLIQGKIKWYKSHGIPYYRPMMFLITDGQPTDDWESAANRLRESLEKKRVSFFAVGLGEADMEILSRISSRRRPLRLKELRFPEMFGWLSSSMSSITHSGKDKSTSLESTDCWAETPSA